MTVQLVRLADLIMAGLIAGTLFGIWIGYNPESLSAEAYVEQQQSAINALNTLMPVLGFITIVLTITSAFMQKSDKTAFATLIVASLCLIVSGLITRFGNQPINSMVMTWTRTEIPASWMDLRDKWWVYHEIRATSALAAFGLIAWTSLERA